MNACQRISFVSRLIRLEVLTGAILPVLADHRELPGPERDRLLAGLRRSHGCLVAASQREQRRLGLAVAELRQANRLLCAIDQGRIAAEALGEECACLVTEGRLLSVAATQADRSGLAATARVLAEQCDEIRQVLEAMVPAT